METQSQIIGINGSVVTLPGDSGFAMKELVCVGRERLVGEVIGVSSRKTTVQVYENTTGLRVGEPVETTGGPLCALLGPGIEVVQRGALGRRESCVEILVFFLIEGAVQVVGLAPVIAGSG